jgi:sortase B
VYAFSTPPPIQDSFSALIALNPETVGYLTIGDMISLPVAQRENDNEFYLTHDFEGGESQAGSLFLDGVNRLELSDKLLIVYGHNMKNGTMFGKLPDYEFTSVLKKNAIVSFNTIYEDRKYVPFACFALTADQSDPSYMELRKFQFTQAQFDDYVAALKKRSLLDISVDVQYATTCSCSSPATTRWRTAASAWRSGGCATARRRTKYRHWQIRPPKN